MCDFTYKMLFQIESRFSVTSWGMQKGNSVINNVSETRFYLTGSSQSVTGKREFKLDSGTTAILILNSVNKGRLS